MKVCGELVVNSRFSLAMILGFVTLQKFHPKEAFQLESLGIHSTPYSVSSFKGGQRIAPEVRGVESQGNVTQGEQSDSSVSVLLYSLLLHFCRLLVISFEVNFVTGSFWVFFQYHPNA